MPIAAPETLMAPRQKRMTLSDAEELIRLHGIDTMGESQLNAAGAALQRPEKFAGVRHLHDCPLFGLAFSTAILRSAVRRLDIIAGSDQLATGVLREELRASLRRLMHRDEGKARVIVVDGNAAGFHELAQEFPGTLNVAEAHAGNPEHPPYHSMVNDWNLLRREAVHPPITANTTSLPADFSSDRNFAGNERKRMDALWDMLMGIEYPAPQPRKLWPWWPRRNRG